VSIQHKSTLSDTLLHLSWIEEETSSILGGKLVDLDKHVPAYFDAKRDSIVLRVCAGVTSRSGMR
jgi:hypothetical protein